MPFFTIFATLIENNQFFQIELITLLASLFLSLLLNRSLPYFITSALCYLTSLGSLTFELCRGSIAAYTYVEASTTLIFILLLIATFVTASTTFRTSPLALKWHTATTLASAIFLAMKAMWILMDITKPIDMNVSCLGWGIRGTASNQDPQVDRCILMSTGFAAMHLLSALLMIHDCPKPQPAQERIYDEKLAIIV